MYTVQVKFEFKFKILGQNWVYDEDLRLLTLKRKNWHNNVLSRRFGKYSLVVKDHSDFYTPAISQGKNEIVLKLLEKDAHINNI